MTVIPGYWMHETTGRLRPAVEAYLFNRPMTGEQIAAMQAYLRQWMAGDWIGEAVAALRLGVDGITTQAALRAWLTEASRAGIDPL
jgi:hypothetical protein